MKILSIDALANEDGWDWNQWYYVGDISKQDFEALTSDPAVRAWLRENGYLANNQQDYHVVDDQYNLVIEEGETNRPIIAIEYGPEYT